MLPRERVIQVINHGRPDRMPIYGWLRENLEDEICGAFGSVEAFEDKYEFDLAHIFGGPRCYDERATERLRESGGGEVLPGRLLELPMGDVNEPEPYEEIRGQIAHHKGQRGRFVYMQTPGIFECLNDVFGIENHLRYLMEHEDDLHRVYRRQAEWSLAFANNCIDLGVDMIHVSDDWGMQRGLMFSPAAWRKLIYPYHRVICEGVRRRGVFLSLHSDGNISSVLDGIVDLGYDVVHPYQESAGMDLQLFKDRYRDSFAVMGGLDIQTTLGFGKLDFLQSEIRRVMEMFADGGLLFCTTHYVQDHCTMEELTFAFDTVCELAREVCVRS
ncbi:MAG: hypothetical protein JSV91_08935 [Phycisphaerales bacterium]|nr:MAG: hypothetical protein JSV91_08935 [Phycisphaerales bacterium]